MVSVLVSAKMVKNSFISTTCGNLSVCFFGGYITGMGVCIKRGISISVSHEVLQTLIQIIRVCSVTSFFNAGSST